MSSVEERVAVLETLAERAEEDKERLFALLANANKSLDAITVTQQKQKSFVGGVVFTVSSVWALVALAIAYVRHGGT